MTMSSIYKRFLILLVLLAFGANILKAMFIARGSSHRRPRASVLVNIPKHRFHTPPISLGPRIKNFWGFSIAFVSNSWQE